MLRARRIVSASFLFPSRAERRRADLFWADLVRETAQPRERAFEDEGSESMLGAGEGTADSLAEGTDVRSRPTVTGTLPDGVVDQIAANRARVPSRAGDLTDTGTGYSYNGRTFTPTVVLSAAEQSNPRLNAIITRLSAGQSPCRSGGVDQEEGGHPLGISSRCVGPPRAC
jgi:hypothetical protein